MIPHAGTYSICLALAAGASACCGTVAVASLVPQRAPQPLSGDERSPIEDALRLAIELAGALALLALSAALVLRALGTGRLPLSDQYEFALAFAWGALAARAVAGLRQARPEITAVSALVALGLLVYAARLRPAVLPPLPVLRNDLLLVLHVGSAVVAYGAGALAFAAAVPALVSRKAGRAEALEGIRFRAATVAFLGLTATLLVGSWWAYLVWGSYWSWDPKESATLATWLVYAVYLHHRSRHEAADRRASWLLALGFATTCLTYAGNLFFQSLHSFTGA